MSVVSQLWGQSQAAEASSSAAEQNATENGDHHSSPDLREAINQVKHSHQDITSPYVKVMDAVDLESPGARFPYEAICDTPDSYFPPGGLQM